MRGEYKVPGGKLVTVEVDLDQGRIANARLAGDFFLEPDDALARINDALVGLPATASVGQIAGAIGAQLRPGDTLIGFSARDIAVALRRALGLASDWDELTFELIEDTARPPAMQMALDQVFAEALVEGRRGPTLRIWEWASPAVVIGSFQSLSNEVDLEAAARHGITVVRRISGGGAMFVEPGNTITYSLVVPASLVDGLSFEQSYQFLDAWVVRVLCQLGIAAAYQPINDIISPAGKIAGAAQKRLVGGAVLHHVTMAYDIDAAKMTEVLRIGREKLSDKGTKSAVKRVDPLRSQTQLPREAIIDALVNGFASQYDLRPSRVLDQEAAAAEELVRRRFGTPQWIGRIP